MDKELPICQKFTLTIQESAKYFGICDKKIREIIHRYPDAGFFLRMGNKYLIKREKFEKLLSEVDCI